MSNDDSPARLALSKPNPEILCLTLEGDWVVGNSLPVTHSIIEAITGGIRSVGFETGGLKRWDSLLLTFLVKLINQCQECKVAVDRSGLPEGARGMLELAAAVPERQGARKIVRHPGLLAQVGEQALEYWQDSLGIAAFLGEATMSLGRFATRKARYRASDFWLLLEDCGASALPIVTLISLLIGLILAFVGAMQLQMFGAQIYISDLVGLGMAREMGAMMTGIIMAGRTGAAFASQLGTMQVNSEIDALKTLGISPIDFLVLPRMLALILMMPLLCLYADFMGIMGGALVSVTMFDISMLEYTQHLRLRLQLIDFSVGVGKCAVFGVLVAIAGCMRGMQCGRSSAAVGKAATSAVVTGIVFIVASDAVMTVILTVLKI